ncbi:MAG: hypothetical protein JNL21_13100 [Myxococcales bacterium]|nr:hypothetical protein [Myxococcales bacterium]
METRAPFRRSALAIALAMAPACASYQPFHPSENATGESPEGESAADYELRAEDGTVFGERRVWSEGAAETEVDGRDATVINVGFLLENETDSPIRVPANALSLQLNTEQGTSYRGVRPVRDPGSMTIPPRDRRRVEVTFELSPDLEPDDITNFRVSWKVDHEDGSFAEVTSFQQTRPAYIPATYDYWYGPGYFGPYR